MYNIYHILYIYRYIIYICIIYLSFCERMRESFVWQTGAQPKRRNWKTGFSKKAQSINSFTHINAKISTKGTKIVWYTRFVCTYESTFKTIKKIVSGKYLSFDLWVDILTLVNRIASILSSSSLPKTPIPSHMRH